MNNALTVNQIELKSLVDSIELKYSAKITLTGCKFQGNESVALQLCGWPRLPLTYLVVCRFSDDRGRISSICCAVSAEYIIYYTYRRCLYLEKNFCSHF